MIKLLEQVNVKLDNLVVKSEHLEHFTKLGLLLTIRHLLQLLVVVVIWHHELLDLFWHHGLLDLF